MSAIDRRETARLLLTRLRAEDVDDLHRLHADPDTMATLGGTRARDETQHALDTLLADWLSDGFGYWLARERATGQFAGRGGLRRVVIAGRPAVEVGYAFLSACWGRGLATELAHESVRVGFAELGLHDLVCFTLPTNRASRRVMEKAGFEYVGDTVWADLPHVLYRLSASDWRSRHQPDSNEIAPARPALSTEATHRCYGPAMLVRAIDHVQLAMPPGGEAAARAFYHGVLGLAEVPKPAPLAARGGCWFEGAAVQLHLGVEADFRPARKAHVALVVHQLAAVLAACRAHGLTVAAAESLDGCERAHVFDPFGNRLEFVERT